MNNKEFTEYINEANKKAKKYKFHINESTLTPKDKISLDVYDINNKYQNNITLTDAEIELYTCPIEDTGRIGELEDYYIRYYVK